MTLVPEMLPRRAVADYLVNIVRLLGFEVTVSDIQTTPPAPDPDPLPAPTLLQPLNADAKRLALQAPMTEFDPDKSGGAHTWSFHGGEFAKAALSFAGDTDTDTLLLKQIRHLLVPGREPTCTGGFQDQKQLCVTAMFTLAAHTPRIWGALTLQEQTKVEKIVFCAAVAGAYTCSDSNPNVLAKPASFVAKVLLMQERDIRGNVLGRDWNPNFQNGFVGQVMVGSLFFGPATLQSSFGVYDHARMVADLLPAGLPNIHRSWTESADVATAAQVDGCLNQIFKWHNIPLTPAVMWRQMTGRTYSKSVNAGLNNGEGQVDKGGSRGGFMPDSNNRLVPNAGVLGMMHEFETKDGGGNRSSMHYTRDSWYVNNYVHFLLIALGYWELSHRTNQPIIDRWRIGTEDWRFKDSHGYVNYQHGKASAKATIDEGKGLTINNEIHRVLDEWHKRKKDASEPRPD